MQCKPLTKHSRRIASLLPFLAALPGMALAAESPGIRLSSPTLGWVLASDGSQLIEIAGIAASPRAGRAIDLPSAARRFWTSPDANAVILRLDTGIFLLRSGDQLEQVAEGIAVTAVWDRASTGFALCWAEKNPPVPDLRIVIGPGTTSIPVDITLSKSYSLPITGDLESSQ